MADSVMPDGYDFIGTQVPWWLVISCRNRWYLKNFVELGAGYGHTSAIASRHFSRVWAVELLPEIFKSQTRDLHGAKNVIRLLGDTVDHLPKIVKQADAPTLWYIDSHWPGMGPKQGPECPIIEEIDILASRESLDRDVILIDNAGLFVSPPPPPHDPREWPTLREVVEAINRAGIAFVQLFADVIIATPEPLGEVL